MLSLIFFQFASLTTAPGEATLGSDAKRYCPKKLLSNLCRRIQMCRLYDLHASLFFQTYSHF